MKKLSHTFPTIGVSIVPQVSINQCKHPERKSVTSIPATASSTNKIILLIHNTFNTYAYIIVRTNLQVVTNIAGNLSICTCLHRPQNVVILSMTNTVNDTNPIK